MSKWKYFIICLLILIGLNLVLLRSFATLAGNKPTDISISISDGAMTTNNVLVNITISAKDASEMCFRNGTEVGEQIANWTQWEPYAKTKQLYLADSVNNTRYKIQVKFKNAYGESNITSDTIFFMVDTEEEVPEQLSDTFIITCFIGFILIGIVVIAIIIDIPTKSKKKYFPD